MSGAYRDRRSKRLRINSSALLRNGTGSRIQANLFNLSEHGCALFVHNVALREGGIYSIKTEGVELLTGRVAWVRRHYAGLEFTHPLHPAVAESLATRYARANDIREPDNDDLLVEIVRHETKGARRLFDPPEAGSGRSAKKLALTDTSPFHPVRDEAIECGATQKRTIHKRPSSERFTHLQTRSDERCQLSQAMHSGKSELAWSDPTGAPQ